MKRVVIVPNFKKDVEFSVTNKVIDVLYNNTYIFMERCAGYENEKVIFVDDNLYDCADAVIVIGGDGTIIKSAVPCAKKSIPILGINLGRIGFMSEVEVNDIEDALNKFIKGEYSIENRMMFKIDIMRMGKSICHSHALNDVVVSKAADATLIGMNIFQNEEKINAYIGDGLIISTPTGSTGYNLSAGGPVVNPLMSLIIASPICAHMLSARPAILPSESPVSIRLDEKFENIGMVVVDGVVKCNIKNGDVVVISKSKYMSRLIKIVKKSFYDVLIDKLS